MRPDESILIFNDRYTVLLEESTEEIPETCRLKTVIVAYIDTLHDDIGRKLRSNTAKFAEDPHHPKAIRTLCDTSNQAIRLEKEQKFASIQDTEILNNSPDSSPQKSGSESD